MITSPLNDVIGCAAESRLAITQTELGVVNVLKVMRHVVTIFLRNIHVRRIVRAMFEFWEKHAVAET